MTRRIRYTLALFVLTAVFLPLSATAVPGDTTDTASELEQHALEQARLMQLLNSDSAEEQERAIRLIGTYAHTDRYDADFFSLLVTPLHGLVAQSPSEELRIMAISALASIGSETAVRGLKTLVYDLESDRVRAITKAAIIASEAPRVAARNQ